jgi:poly(hydroxyalkanoate) granule-associated protein
MPHSGIEVTDRTRRRRYAAERNTIMTAKKSKKAKQLQNELVDSAHRVWLAGLGAMAMAEEESNKFFKALVERGQSVETRGKEQVEKAKGTVTGMKTVAESYWETFERTLDDQVTAIIHRLGVPTKSEIEELTRKVEQLTGTIEKLAAKPAAAKPVAAKKSSTATKKATSTTKKATEEKAN